MKNNKQFRNKRGILLVILLLVVVSSLVLSGCAAEKKVYKVGVLLGLNFISPIGDGIKAGMAELGYVEGKNIVFLWYI